MTIRILHGTHFETTLSRELLALVLGEMIGEGQFRMVYPWLPDLKLVCKIEPNGGGNFCNEMEYRVWQEVKDTKMAKWFAPVFQISGCGVIQLQYRTQPVQMKDLPKRVPAFFTDLKRSNWGWFRGRVVCHDYGFHQMLARGITCGMKKAEWRDH